MSSSIVRFNRKWARSFRRMVETPKGRQQVQESLAHHERVWATNERLISQGVVTEQTRAEQDTLQHNLRILRDVLGEVAA